ncbi:MAG TPA: sigma-70 family RNA polymerase sigma factor [Anaeromyxobacteraceae bacterium]|nr:sigma-70 family RNA polymerase sigma factor [Anaeromyxobacteraceae bacterium]
MAIVPGGAREGANEDPLRHADGLYQLARHLARDAADAEDLVQETYARAFRAMERFSPGTDLRAWLFRILRNAFLDTRRRESRSPLDRDADLEAVAERPAPEEGALRGDRELERLRGIVGSEIEAALRQLSEEARLVVLLDLEGLAEAEIADVMGCAAGTVKSRLSRGRAALRELLADYRR